LTLNIPTGWTAEPATAEYALGAGRYRDFDFTVSPSADTEPGCYLVGASISEGGQTVQDLCRVLVGTSEIETVQADILSDSLLLAVGESGQLRVRLASDAMSDVPVQVQLITSWDLWAMTPDWNTGAVIPARGSVDVDFTVATGNTAKPGRWWALVKVSAVGRVMFTKAVNVEIAAK
jgi:alpha-mannosidase